MKIALESTLITHGFQQPQNLEVAFLLEETARDAGCQPLTIGIIGGQIRVGLTPQEITQLAEHPDVVKAGVREIPVVMAQGRWASTTVSATMRIASQNGISVFATGGIGGVHPGKWDVSQDIVELSRSRMVVISAGPKAILDLPGTSEMLESFGVTVVGYRTERMPAFYTRESGIPISRVDSAEEISQIYRHAEEHDLPGAVLVFNPIPTEFEISEEQIAGWREKALQDLDRAGVTGKAVTPFLLTRMAEHSGGRTVESNIQLLKNNVILGCQIVKALSG
jgi:pseudouridine-5'-phosphate glycosidase